MGNVANVILLIATALLQCTHNWKMYLVSVHLVIATPGRVLDLMNKGVLVAKNCRMLILDEVSRVVFTDCGASLVINTTALLCFKINAFNYTVTQLQELIAPVCSHRRPINCYRKISKACWTALSTTCREHDRFSSTQPPSL